MSNFFRKVKRNQERKERDTFREELVRNGKKVVFNPKTEKIEIVDVKKPYRKEIKDEGTTNKSLWRFLCRFVTSSVHSFKVM